jgi:hypothetical protein
MTIFAKDPSSTLDYSFDWTGWLAPGEAITADSWNLFPSGGDAPTLSVVPRSGTITAVNVAAGTIGNRYRLSCQITTDAGRTAERSTAIRVMEV